MEIPQATQKQAEKDESYSDLHCRVLYCWGVFGDDFSDKHVFEGHKFNKNFRELLANSENLTSEVLINFFVSDSYAQRIREIYTRDTYPEVPNRVTCIENEPAYQSRRKTGEKLVRFLRFLFLKPPV